MKSKARRILESVPNLDIYRKSLKDNDKVSLKQMLRDAIISEFDAVSIYDLQASSVDDEVVRKTLLEIRDEEIAHIGELFTLMRRVQPNWDMNMDKGIKEVMEKIGELK